MIAQGTNVAKTLCWVMGTAVSLNAQTLPNGIQMPPSFPPAREATQAYEVPSYLRNPPPVIPIDVGRQLFVDDFLIESTTLERVQHRPEMHPLNPILAPGGPDTNDSAFPFSDGVWFDPADRLFKMWYYGDSGRMLSYAVSDDGIQWTKPALSDAVVPGTNQVLEIPGGRDSTTVWMDLDDPDPRRKFKAFAYVPPGVFRVHFSPDGIHWGPLEDYDIETLSDRSTVFWNPFRKVWVASLRARTFLPPAGDRGGYTARGRFYAESPDLSNWSPRDFLESYWTGPDEMDPPYAGEGGALPELYNLDAVAYESLMVGLFSWYHPGPERDATYGPGPNLVELGVGFSRDGYQWERPTRGFGTDAFIQASNQPGTWDEKNTQSAGGGFLVVGDELWFYFSGRLEKPSNVGATGLGILRRDGFYSMYAGADEGTLTTRPVRFSGNRMFVNVDAPDGELRIEVLDEAGNAIPAFARAASVPIGADATMTEVRWEGAADLASLSGQPVRFRFHLRSGDLYSFWVTDSANGASHGYVAAGGPGFTRPVDDQGSAIAQGTVESPRIVANGRLENGEYQATAIVELESPTAGTIVRFTTDGSDPSLSAPIYSAPFRVAATSTIRAKAWKGGMSPSPEAIATLRMARDTMAPSVAISGIDRGEVLQGLRQFTLETSDDFAVDNVRVEFNGQDVRTFSRFGGGFEAGQESLMAPLDTRELPNGTGELIAIATDLSGNEGRSAPIAVTVDNDTTPPSIQIDAPVSGQAVSGMVTLLASATDDRGLREVQFFLDGIALGTPIAEAPFEARWLSSNARAGNRALTAEARDTAGNISVSNPVEVQVDNAAGLPPAALSIWTFDYSDAEQAEPGETALLDRSGNRHDAAASQASFVPGRSGEAMRFDGERTRAVLSDGAAFDLTGDLTLSVWLRTTNNRRDEAILGKFSPSSSEFGYLLHTTRDGRIGLRIGGFNLNGDVGPDEFFDDTRINDGQWHQVTVVIQLGEGVRFFVDGAAGSQHRANIIAETTSALFQLGISEWEDYGDYFTGDLDQVRVFNRALTGDEATALAREF